LRETINNYYLFRSFDDNISTDRRQGLKYVCCELKQRHLPRWLQISLDRQPLQPTTTWLGGSPRLLSCTKRRHIHNWTVRPSRAVKTRGDRVKIGRAIEQDRERRNRRRYTCPISKCIVSTIWYIIRPCTIDHFGLLQLFHKFVYIHR
jgi:hypothetical protein